MKKVRIYEPKLDENADTIELSAEGSHHVGVVLRMQVGEPLTLFCGDNREFSATLLSVSKKRVVVTIDSVEDKNRESPCAIHLAQAVSKGERMEWVVQKAVELGVASITPLITAFSVVRLDALRMEKKRTQWQSIAIAACEQSGRNQVPVIHQPRSFGTYINECHAPMKLILHPTAGLSWRNYAFGQEDIVVLIGPEGGFSEEEVSDAKRHAFQPICLGPRILRTETAAIATISLIQSIVGDF